MLFSSKTTLIFSLRELIINKFQKFLIPVF